MKFPIRLGITTVASPLEVGAGDAPALLLELVQAFEQEGFDRLEIIPSPQPVTTFQLAEDIGAFFRDRRVDAVCVVAASWYEDYLVLDMLERCDVPLITWARPGMETGSLCGMQQLDFMLKQLGKPYCFLFDELQSKPALERAYRFAASSALKAFLRRSRIGYLGHRVEGMTETTANELALKRIFGPRVVGIDSQVFLTRAASIPADSVTSDWKQVRGKVGTVTSTEEAGIESMQVTRAMREFISETGLSAVAVGCYPHLMGKVCLAASLLGEEGIPVACEGDVNGALGMLMLTFLSGSPIHNTDLLDPIPAQNAIIFSHCGSGGFSLAESPAKITLGSVRLMNCGMCALFTAKPGAVTLLNITAESDGYRMAALYGEAIETDMIFPGNPMRVKFQSDYRDILRWIAENGLGHHWMAAYGDWRQPLADLAKMTGCGWLEMA